MGGTFAMGGTIEKFDVFIVYFSPNIYLVNLSYLILYTIINVTGS